MKKTVSTTITTSQVVADLLAAYEIPPLLDGDITPARMAAQSRHKADYWRTRLDAKVDAGELVRVFVINPATNHRTTAYRPAPPKGE